MRIISPLRRTDIRLAEIRQQFKDEFVLTKVTKTAADATEGDTVQASVQGHKIIIEPLKQVQDQYNLEELVSQMPKDYRPEAVDRKTPVGKEKW